MRGSVVLQVLLGAGALAHPHFKLDNPLAHVHHKRQQPAEIITTTVGNQVEIEDIFVATVWNSAPPAVATPAPTPTPPVVVAAPEKLAVAPVANNQNSNQDNQNWDQNNQDWNYQSHFPASVTPASVTPVSVTPISITPSVTPVSVTPAAPASPGNSGSSNDDAPQSGGVSILDTANKYRVMMGYSPFTYSSTLAGNAGKTNTHNGANEMLHQLNPGSFAQCISQVDNNSVTNGLSPFELIYLAWLCEIPDGRITGVCNEMLAATNMKMNYADPGHAQILRTSSYSQIGCNYLTSTEHHDMFVGMWTCDFK